MLRLVTGMPGAKKREMIKTAWSVKDSKKKGREKEAKDGNIERGKKHGVCVMTDLGCGSFRKKRH